MNEEEVKATSVRFDLLLVHLHGEREGGRKGGIKIVNKINILSI
jgi:hypothetical protein